MQRYALIVAGGSGSRMKADIPKQFLLLAGKPILAHTLERFRHCDGLVVVLPDSEKERWEKLCIEHRIIIPHKVVSGGDTRFASVKNGLEHIPPLSMVAIHDGVRPLIRESVIDSAFDQAAEKGNAIPTVAPKNSLRMLTDQGSVHVRRELYREIQTPQTFRTPDIHKAYEQEYQSSFTDDASVLEAAGMQVHLMEGHYENIKITTPEDLIMAEQLLVLSEQ